MTPPNDRQRQAEAKARKYADDSFATQYDDEYWVGKSSYLQGWTDADSTPPQQEGDEEAANNYCSTLEWKSNNTAPFTMAQSDLYEEKYKAFIAGAAHARRAQNAEVERLKVMLTEAVDSERSLRSLLERAMTWVKEHHEMPGYSELISDYERMKESK